MSTILRALQKNKLGAQAGSRDKIKPNLTWRIMVLVGIALIIMLLSGLLYIRLFPAVEAKPVAIKRVLNPVSKIVFQTQSMPEKAQEKTIVYVAKPVKKTVSKPSLIPTKKEELKDQQEMNAVSDKMKQRFALAVSLTDNEAEVNNVKVNPAADSNDGLESADGSDIRDMSSRFQQGIPSIS